MKTLRRFVAGLLLAGLSAVAVAGSGYKYLNVDEVIQEHSNWCWAASSVDVLRFYGMNPNQCDVVNWAYGINYACGNNSFYWNSWANTANGMYGSSGSIQDILNSWGVSNQAYATYLSWNSIVSDVNANRPFVIRFGWYGGGGHFMVGYGYYDQGGTPMVGYMNPWPGEGYSWSNYNWMVYAAYDHSWTHSLRMTR